MSSTSNKVFPGFDHLYKYSGPCTEEPFSANLDIDYGRIQDMNALTKAERIPDRPLVAKWFLGPPTPGDLVWGGAPGLIFISERVRRAFEDCKLTGWSTYPIILYDEKGNQCRGYAGLCVTGRCGPIDEDRGELLEPDPKFPRYRGIFFEESTWDGSDFFLPGDTGGSFIVTEAVKKVFEQLDLIATDIDFTPLTEAERLEIREDVEDEEDENQFLESLYLDKELDPRGFVNKPPSPLEEGVTLDYTVVYPYDNSIGKRFRVCNTFDEAKAFVLRLQAEGIEEAVILRSHEVVWSSIPPHKS